MKRLALSFLAILAACTGPQGPAGQDGDSCAVTDNGDGTKTVSCPGSNPVTIANGTDGGDGTSCTVADNGDGTKTVSCTDGTSVSISDGSGCSMVDNGNGTTTISCPGSNPITIAEGTTCAVVSNAGVEVLSCSDGSRAVISPPIDTVLAGYQDLPGVVVSVVAVGGHSNADGSFHPGDHVGVTFSIRTTAGRGIPIEETDLAGVWLAGPSANYQHILPAARDQSMYTDVGGASLNDDGTYTYAIPDAIPADFGVPLFDTTKFSDGELTGPLTAGTYTIGLVVSKNYTIDGQAYNDAGSTTHDVGLDTTTLSSHQIVSDANCQSCHTTLRMHEGMFRSVDTCVTCHTSGAEDVGSTDTGDATPNTIELRVMLHKLHSGVHLPSVQGTTVNSGGGRVYGTGTPYLVGDDDFSNVQFPAYPNFNIALPKHSGYSLLASANKTKDDAARKGITDCASCHGDPDGAGPLSAPADAGELLTDASRRSCGSCHDDLDFTKPYVVDGNTMPANATDDACHFCHNDTNIPGYHQHPLRDTTVAPTIAVGLLSMSGATGGAGQFLPGDPLSLTFDIKDAGGADLPINYLDSMTMIVNGPTQARQVVIPGEPTGSVIDFAGRLASASTTNKGTMSKVYTPGAGTTSEPLVVDFSSSTAFTVTGVTTGALGGGALPAAATTAPSGASLSNFVLTSAAVAQNITVSFSSPTAYSVTGSVTGAMGAGVLPASVSNTQRFTSSDGSVAFNIVLGTTAAASGQNFYLTVVKTGAANPLAFAVVAGRTAFAAGDRFYYDYVAPAATYTFPVSEDLALEYLGRGNGTAGQIFTAANLPVWYGRQTLLERTATPGLVMTLAKPVAMMSRYLYVSALDPGVAANDYLVIDDGTGNEEYVRVNAVDAATGRVDLTTGGGSTGYSSNPTRFAHGAAATVQEVTMTYRQEGAANYYTLAGAAGTVTLTGSSTNAFVMTYRTTARFGWKRKVGDTIAPFYYANLIDDPKLDETWGDWRGKPIIDGTYTISLWGYRTVEYRSGSSGAFEWQSYRNPSHEATRNFLYGATATTVVPYDKIDDTTNCDGCHRGLSFHGGTRSGGDTCLMCHATPGPGVHMRTLAHEWHVDALPVMPNGSASCVKCHGTHDVTSPASRNHPTAQGMASRDWTRACTSCHSSSAAGAHADTMTSSSTGAEACATCHDPDRPYAVADQHKPR